MNESGKLHHLEVANDNASEEEICSNSLILNGDPNGVRTRVSTLKGTRFSSGVNDIACTTEGDFTAQSPDNPPEWQTFRGDKRMKYVTCRRNRDGNVRWYWQRKGFPLRRLSDDPAVREDQVREFNGDAERPQRAPETRYSAEAPFWKAKLNLMRGSAKTRGIPFLLTLPELRRIVARANGHCELTGLRFVIGDETDGKRNPCMPSIDRKDAKGPYSFENCRLICFAANIALNDWGDDVVRMVATGLLLQEAKKK